MGPRLYVSTPRRFPVVGTALGKMGLMYMTVSLYQLIRCTVIIVVALFKVFVLRQPLKGYMWAGVIINSVLLLKSYVCSMLCLRSPPSAQPIYLFALQLVYTHMCTCTCTRMYVSVFVFLLAFLLPASICPLAVAAMMVISSTSFIHPAGEQGGAEKDPRIGIFFVVMSCIVQGAQYGEI